MLATPGSQHAKYLPIIQKTISKANPRKIWDDFKKCTEGVRLPKFEDVPLVRKKSTTDGSFGMRPLNEADSGYLQQQGAGYRCESQHCGDLEQSGDEEREGEQQEPAHAAAFGVPEKEGHPDAGEGEGGEGKSGQQRAPCFLTGRYPRGYISVTENNLPSTAIGG